MKATGTSLSAVAMLLVGVANPAAALSPLHSGGERTHVPCRKGALIRAIEAANAHGGTLALARHCTYDLTTPYAGVDGLPVITKRITINGNGATIQRNASAALAFRIFDVAGPRGNLTVKDLTIQGGKLT